MKKGISLVALVIFCCLTLFPTLEYAGIQIQNITQNRISKGQIEVSQLYNKDKEFIPPTIPLSTNDDSIFNVRHQDSNLQDEVTIVTAYFNLGTFQKGEQDYYYKPELFLHWMKVFSRITNPLVVYVEDKNATDYFKVLRREHAENTRIVQVMKDQLWGFKYLEEITTLFASDNYPKHHPNTVIPEYPCVVNSKYEFAFLTAKNNPFKTKYITWLDIGYFRDIVDKNCTTPIKLYKPAGLNDSLVAFNQVYSLPEGSPEPVHIFYLKYDWVGTGFFLATTEVMARWARQYMLYVECYLAHNLVNSDQQAIYAMFMDRNVCSHLSKDVQLQIYYSGYIGDWFYLGYQALSEGQKKYHLPDCH